MFSFDVVSVGGGRSRGAGGELRIPHRGRRRAGGGSPLRRVSGEAPVCVLDRLEEEVDSRGAEVAVAGAHARERDEGCLGELVVVVADEGHLAGHRDPPATSACSRPRASTSLAAKTPSGRSAAGAARRRARADGTAGRDRALRDLDDLAGRRVARIRGSAARRRAGRPPAAPAAGRRRTRAAASFCPMRCSAA